MLQMIGHLHRIDGEFYIHVSFDFSPAMASVNSRAGLVTMVKPL